MSVRRLAWVVCGVLVVTGIGEAYQMSDHQSLAMLQKFLPPSQPSGEVPLPDVSYSVPDTIHISGKMDFQLSGGAGFGPTELISINQVNGTILSSGSAYLEAFLYLGQLEMSYNSANLNLLGFKYEGSLKLRVEEAVSRVRIEARTSVFARCDVHITLEPPQGRFLLLTGSETGELLLHLLETGLEITEHFSYLDVQKRLGDWALFLPLRDRLQDSLVDTAHKMFCKNKKP